MTDAINIARSVIALEIDGLKALEASLDDQFSKAVEILRGVTGRIVVTGMGKSGHVASKIAATLASTGAPAMFVHPAEASHGDLGMISRNDAILALSKSGETAELRDLLAFGARFAIPIIAITADVTSTLAKAANITLRLPAATEACGETRAPTTSTTMMIALGDALSVALLRSRGFTADDFKGYHPGGTLGAALRRVSDLMQGADRLPLCAATDMTKTIVATISHHNFGCVGVIDENGDLAGVITDGDLRRALSEDISSKTAQELMSPTPIVTRQDALAGDVLAMMSKRKITALFVVEGAKPVGLVHIHDCLTFGVI